MTDVLPVSNFFCNLSDWNLVNAAPIRRSISCLASTASFMWGLGLSGSRRVLMISLSINAENRAR